MANILVYTAPTGKRFAIWFGSEDNSVEYLESQVPLYVPKDSSGNYYPWVIMPEEDYVPDPPEKHEYGGYFFELFDTTVRTRNRQHRNVECMFTYPETPDRLTFIAWREACWAYLDVEYPKIVAGTRTAPAAYELVNELPAIVWDPPEV